MFHRRKHFVCLLSFQRTCLGECNIPWSLHPSQSQLNHWQTIPNQIKRTKKKELFRYLLVFLTIYFKYFEGEFWWAKGLRVREECLCSGKQESYDRKLFLMNLTPYRTLNKITQFWLVEGSTINPKLYSVGVPIKFPWKRRNFVECTINKISHEVLVQFVNNRYSWFWKFSNCTRLKARAILRTFKITRTY